jgi:hypothetical protein
MMNPSPIAHLPCQSHVLGPTLPILAPLHCPECNDTELSGNKAHPTKQPSSSLSLGDPISLRPPHPALLSQTSSVSLGAPPPPINIDNMQQRFKANEEGCVHAAACKNPAATQTSIENDLDDDLVQDNAKEVGDAEAKKKARLVSPFSHTFSGQFT